MISSFDENGAKYFVEGLPMFLAFGNETGFFETNLDVIFLLKGIPKVDETFIKHCYGVLLDTFKKQKVTCIFNREESTWEFL